MANVQQVKRWASGDFLYAAMRTGMAPSGTAHVLVDGREYPVAQIAFSGNVVRWISRYENFPLPIKGFNEQETL